MMILLTMEEDEEGGEPFVSVRLPFLFVLSGIILKGIQMGITLLLLGLVVENTKEESDRSKKTNRNDGYFRCVPKWVVCTLICRLLGLSFWDKSPPWTPFFLVPSLAEPKRIHYKMFVCCPSGMIWPSLFPNPAILTLYISCP